MIAQSKSAASVISRGKNSTNKPEAAVGCFSSLSDNWNLIFSVAQTSSDFLTE